MREKRGCSVAMNKVVLTGKIAAMPSKEAFDAADDQGVRFDLVIVSQWQNSEEVHHEWFACVVHGKQAETFLRYTQKGASIKINGHFLKSDHRHLMNRRKQSRSVMKKIP